MRSRLALVFSAFLGIISNVHEAVGADYQIQPSIAVAEEYNDNIYETPSNKVSDFITHLIPGIAIKYSAPAWDWEGAYTFDYSYYTRLGKDQDTHALTVRGLTKIVDEFLFLEVTDSFQRASLDVTRDVTQESSFSNQSDQNIFTVSPYLVFRPTSASKVKTGYRYSNIWYREAAGLDKNQHDLFAEGTFDLSAHTSATANYTFSRQDTSVNSMDKHDILAGLRHEYLENSYIYAQAGTSIISYTPGGNSSSLIWNAGILHTFDSVILSFDTGVRFDEDPLRNTTKETFYTGKAVKKYGRGEGYFSLFYSDFDNPLSGSGQVAGLLSATPQTSKYGASLGVKHELKPNLIGTANFTVERYEYPGDSYSTRMYADYGVSYLLPRDFTVSLNHRYFRYSSPTIASDNKEVNRIILEVRKIF